MTLIYYFTFINWWNCRSKRLDRIAQSMRQPNLSQSTLCSATSSMLPNGQNGRSGGRNSLDNGQIINAFSNSSSPAHSPNCPPGAIDIEVEVGDHEVDTMFRDPGPKPLIVARATPPLQVCIYYQIPLSIRLDFGFYVGASTAVRGHWKTEYFGTKSEKYQWP